MGDQSQHHVLFAGSGRRHTVELCASLAVAPIVLGSEHDDERRTVLDGRRCGALVRTLVSDVRLGPLGFGPLGLGPLGLGPLGRA